MGFVGAFDGMIGVFFTASVMVVNLLVNLIHVIPDAAMQWIGAQTQSSGAGSRASGEFSQAAVGATAAGKNMMQQAAGNQRQRSRDKLLGPAAATNNNGTRATPKL